MNGPYIFKSTVERVSGDQRSRMEGQQWNIQNYRIIRMQGTQCEPGVWSCLWIKRETKGRMESILRSPGRQWWPGCEGWGREGPSPGPLRLLVISAKGSKEVRKRGDQGRWIFL